MADVLTAHLNADGLNSVSIESVSFETTGSFSVVLENHGSPTHVHLRLEDELASVASVAATNHYVDANGKRVVRVTVPDGVRPISGGLTVFTAYGSESASVPVRVREPTETDEGVAVAAELAEKPTGTRASRTTTDVVPAVVAGTSVLLAGASFLTLSGLVALFVGGVFLVGGLATALFLARQIYS